MEFIWGLESRHRQPVKRVWTFGKCAEGSTTDRSHSPKHAILPFTVLRRLEAVLEATKEAVLERKSFLDTHKVAE